MQSERCANAFGVRTRRCRYRWDEKLSLCNGNNARWLFVEMVDQTGKETHRTTFVIRARINLTGRQ
jgi:hypothetical protein